MTVSNYFLQQLAAKIAAGDVGVQNVSANTILANTLSIVYFLVGAISVIVIIVAGIMYTISSGDTGKVTKAKNMLTYAIVGLIVVFFAFIITNYVIGRFK